MKVPSGQSVAKAMTAAGAGPEPTWPTWRRYHLHKRTPLWFYVLREAQVQAGGEHLGPVGGRIVAEVIIGLHRGRQPVLPHPGPRLDADLRQRWDVRDDRPPDHGGGRRLALVNAYPVCAVSGTVGPVTDAPPTGPTAIAVAPATDPETGLTSAEVAERTSRGQVNATDQASSRSLWVIFKTNVFTRFNAILGALFVLILSTGSLADGLFGVVLVVNSAIGIVQEYLAKRKLDRLALLNSPTTGWCGTAR